MRIKSLVDELDTIAVRAPKWQTAGNIRPAIIQDLGSQPWMGLNQESAADAEAQALMHAVDAVGQDAKIVCYLPILAGAALSSSESPARTWASLTWGAELAREAVQQRSAVDGTCAYLAPLHDRLCFLLLSAPFREVGDAPLTTPFSPDKDGITSLEHRALEARNRWAERLAANDGHPALHAQGPGWIDREVALLAFTHPPRGQLMRLDRELDETPSWPRKEAAAERRWLDRLSRKQFLPRMMLAHAWRTYWASRASRDFVVERVITLLPLLLMIAAVATAPFFSGLSGWWVAAAAYAALWLGVMWCGPPLADVYCLRMPASTLVGLVALVALPAGWWDTGVGARWSLIVASFGATFAYLVVEARADDTRVPAALGRAAVAWLLSSAHAGCLAILVFRAANLALFTSDPIDGWGVVEGAAIGMTVGIAVQNLWQGAPITSPLLRTTWRGHS